MKEEMSIENVGFLVVRNNRAVSSVGRASRLHRACPLLISPANPSLLQIQPTFVTLTSLSGTKTKGKY